jgi:signal transduction histidine kinase
MEQRSIRLQTKFVRPAYVWGRPGELRQVFTNLIGNAIDALPQGGIIRVTVSCASNSEGACITIADSGPGVAPDLREKIFEPFFSTKHSKGTGLGLWISQGIIRKYGGHIRLRSRTAPGPKTGTIFRVCMPGHCRSLYSVAIETNPGPASESNVRFNCPQAAKISRPRGRRVNVGIPPSISIL